ncbi:MAG: ribose 5-phosphate isomerase A [Melioribacteraceae bacterium]|nr:ribose 5-phosphate isomerase A [Melioribacteraceae bacterium]WKZ69103.1 MAG: ribose 5-phosphate isomerase A [Melioribacteraceae bacterium]
MDIEELKKQAAEKAVEQIQSGMVVGLGTGSTTTFAIQKIAELLKSGQLKNIVGIPTSKTTEELARSLNIPLTTFAKIQEIDLTIDGADEVDFDLNLIKGGGGALLREKVVAQASKKVIIIVDESKVSKHLGEKWHVPIEVLQFCVELEKKYLESIGARVKLRSGKDGNPFITDEGNYILDANFGVINSPQSLAGQLESRAGIVEHGLFIGLADEVIVAASNGTNSLKKSKKLKPIL